MKVRPLPSQAEALLLQTKSPPRLRAHLSLVHDVACQLTAKISAAWPNIVFDKQAVHLGAATHDIGKVVHVHELSEPGHEHEEAGQTLLLKHGWSQQSARFAVTHARGLDPTAQLEDLLVATADNIWKGKRNPALDQSLTTKIAALSTQEPWQVWLSLDDILSALAEPAAERLRWQASHAL